MRHRVKKLPRLGRQADHARLLLRNLAASLILHDKIQTTAAKARAVQPFVERVIVNTRKKTSDREAIRYLKATLLGEKAQKKALLELKPRYADRTSGFTRITPLGPRAGDGAEKVQIELV